MTRADPSAEPTMEDILASIRKIIAEDPPGSRPAPEPRPQFAPTPAPSQAFRPLQRESEAPAPVSSPVPEPYLHSGSQPAPFLSMTSFQSAGISETHQTYADPFATAPAPIATQPARGPSVDDQLSELLGEVPISEKNVKPAPLARPVSRSISASPGFIAKMTAQTAAHNDRDLEHDHALARPHAAPHYEASLANTHDAVMPASGSPVSQGDQAAPVQPEAAIAERAGFTVSRAGYIPEAAATNNQPNPFDFQLGPSPFAGKLYAAEPVLASATAPTADLGSKATPADLGSIIPSRHFDFPDCEDARKPSLRVPRPVPGFEPRAEAHPAATRAEQAFDAAVAQPAELAVAATAAIAEVEAPVAVVMAEPVAVAAPAPMPQVMTLETLLPPSTAALVEAAAPVETPHSIAAELATPFETDESPAAHQGELAAEYLAEIEAMTPEVEAEEAVAIQEHGQASTIYNNGQSDAASSPFASAFAHRQVAPYSAPDVPERSMEDTVAELLRPMLKNWLAENMPKIVERALRREIAESFALEHKPAAE